MTDQEWFEAVIEIWNQFEVIKWHEGNQLHVLNKNEERKETNISDE
jgi:hypothetical protein